MILADLNVLISLRLSKKIPWATLVAIHFAP